MTREEAVQALHAVKDELIGRHFEFKGHVSAPITAIDMAIEALSADAVQVWIPCSERLPENNGCMLVTIDDAIEFGKYEDGEWSIWVCEHWDEWDAKGVIAWMPLPEPWKGGEEE